MGLQHNHTHGHLPLAKLKTLMWEFARFQFVKNKASSKRLNICRAPFPTTPPCYARLGVSMGQRSHWSPPPS